MVCPNLCLRIFVYVHESVFFVLNHYILLLRYICSITRQAHGDKHISINLTHVYALLFLQRIFRLEDQLGQANAQQAKLLAVKATLACEIRRQRNAFEKEVHQLREVIDGWMERCMDGR